jgi:hypothetical protein
MPIPVDSNLLEFLCSRQQNKKTFQIPLESTVFCIAIRKKRERYTTQTHSISLSIDPYPKRDILTFCFCDFIFFVPFDEETLYRLQQNQPLLDNQP